jgi:heat shock protein HslJ
MRTAAILLILLLLASCARFGAGGSGGPGGSGSGASPSGITSAQLSGSWRLLHGSGPDGTLHIPAATDITIAFEGFRVNGRACNLYGGTYRLGHDGALTLSAMGMTEMACEEPLMSLEAAYHAALALVKTAALDGNQLTLSGHGAELVFARVAPLADASLVGTHWTLVTLFQGDVASSTPGKGWLQLDADSILHGSTGCRGFDARYAVAGDRLRISGLVVEDNACEPDTVAQDRLVLEVLRGGLRFVIRGRDLTLTDAGVVGGKGLGYVAAAEE